MFNKIFILIVLNLVIRILCIVISRFINGFYWTNLSNKLNSNMVSRYDLSKILDYNFINWCYKLSERLNFTSIDLVNSSLKKDIQICGYENSSKVYIKCIKLEENSQEKDDNFDEVNLQEVEQLLGIMERDIVKKAYIMTTGNFSQEVIEFVNTLPQEYEIKLISGDILTALSRRTKESYYAIPFSL